MPSLEDLRRGQAAVCQRFKDGLNRTVAKLPTGYGKTRTAATSFAILRALDLVDVMILVVPQVGQAAQAEEDIPRDLGALGIGTDSCNIGENATLALRHCRSGASIVFIVTVQSIVQGRRTLETINEITGGKRCFLVVDEYHHYGADTAWTREVTKIRHVAFLAMSATPDRKGETPIFGEPDVSVSYSEAVKEGAVKPLSLHAYDYRVDFVNNETGEVGSFPISELIAAVGMSQPEKIEKWAAARGARWTPKYVSPLLSNPINRLINLYANTRFEGQMIVYALCCSHAKTVCEQIRSLIPRGMTIDWVGSGPKGRSDEENRDILNRFCPPKDRSGKRPWSLHILVCVGMAGEGLDIRDATECVFLNSPTIHNTAKQNIGRLSRRIAGQDELVGNVNVDSGSEWAKFIGQNVQAALDVANGDVDDIEPEEDDDDPTRRRADEYKPIPDGPIVAVTDVELIDIQSDPMFVFIKSHVKTDAMAHGWDDAAAERSAHDAALRYMREKDERFSATYRQGEARKLLDARTRKVAGLALRIALERGRGMTREMPGDFMKRINTARRLAFGRIETLTDAQIEQANDWVRALEAALLRGEIPTWL